MILKIIESRKFTMLENFFNMKIEESFCDFFLSLKTAYVVGGGTPTIALKRKFDDLVVYLLN